MKSYIVEVKHVFPVRYKGEKYPTGSQLEVSEEDLNGDLFEVVSEAEPKKAAPKKAQPKATSEEE